MIKRLAATVAVLLFPVALLAQTPSSVITRPLEPSARDLDRLNLTVAWRLYLPIEKTGDGIAVVQTDDDQVFVQLKSGMMLAIQAHADPRTFRKPGDIIWRYRPVNYGGVIYPAAFSPIKMERKESDKLVPVREVYMVLGQQLVVLDRADGKVKYIEQLTSTASAGPAADETQVYIPLANRRISVYSHAAKEPGFTAPKPPEYPDPVKNVNLAIEPADVLSTPNNRSPSIAALEIFRPPFKRSADYIDSSVSLAGLKSITPPYRSLEGGRTPSVIMLPSLVNVYELSAKSYPTRLHYAWELFTSGIVNATPLLTRDADDPSADRITAFAGREIFTATREGERYNRISAIHMMEANVSAPLTNHGDTVYVATLDSNVLSFSMKELREPSLARNTLPRGTYTTGGPVMKAPLLTEDSLYIVGERWGMMRLKKTSLDPMWSTRLPDGRIQPKPNGTITRVLAANSEYVYALDRNNNLAVLDAKRGDTLSTFDVSQFNVPVTNDETDRLFLAANNGLLLCIRDKDRVKPEFLRPSLRVPPKKVVEPEVKKDPEVKIDPVPKKEPEKKEPEKKEPEKKEPEKKELEKKEPEKKEPEKK